MSNEQHDFLSAALTWQPTDMKMLLALEGIAETLKRVEALLAAHSLQTEEPLYRNADGSIMGAKDIIKSVKPVETPFVKAQKGKTSRS